MRRDVENVEVSGALPNTIVGNTQANVLVGNGTIRGGLGDDTISSTGAGTYDGGPGNDTVKKARFDYSPEPVRLLGSTGDDTFDSFDMSCTDEQPGTFCQVEPSVKDVVSCGKGRDTVAADDLDATAADCESVTEGGN